MATNFPVSLDSLTNPTSGNTLNSPSHSSQHANSNDAIEAIQAKIGVDNSAVTTTLDYKVRVNTPAGAIVLWGTNTAPTGWLVCDGSAVSRSTYSGLFAVVGTTYGAGNGSTTFNLPNLKGRVPVGRDATDTDFDVLGETRGSKTHTLTTAEMPSHTHVQNAHTHIQDTHTHIQDTHSHSITINANTLNMVYNPGAYNSTYISGKDSTNDGIIDGTTNTFGMALDFVNDHTHTASASNTVATNQNTIATNQNTIATNQSTGDDGAHNNIQPSIVLNYIIKH